MFFRTHIGRLMTEADSRNELPEETPSVRFIENVWIPMSDGTRIAARLWLPAGAERVPVPALIHYHPYRQQGDGTLATHGYAFLIPDIRGAGQSEGGVQDEYVQQEQDDAVDIINWLALQPWCTGKVGMFGSSWSGFSALQTAARRPPALKAIIAQCCSDDRYADDAHYLGGCITQEMFVWGSLWTSLTPRPPDPKVVGECWREMWMERLESLEFFVGDWLSHQHRDAFWKHGSVCEDFSQIECAVYAVGGWADPYHPAVPRLLAGLKCPRKGLIGPWTHSSFRSPGPGINWLKESLRWWDYWLKNKQTGVMDEPAYRVWMQEEEALLGMRTVVGRWVAEDAWPSARIENKRFYLTGAGLRPKSSREVAHVVNSPQTVGAASPHLCPFDLDTEMPDDQRIDDARSLCFDSEPLSERLEILGAPILTLDLSVDKPVAFLAIRLNEVKPTGESTRVTFQVLNLTHRDSHEEPTPLVPGKRYRIRIPLRDHAYAFKPAHRLRVAISTTYWPLIWPSPEAVTLTVYSGRSELELPVRPARAADAALVDLGSESDYLASGVTRPFSEPSNRGEPTRKIYKWDNRTRKLTIRSRSGEVVGTRGPSETLEIRDNDPLSAKLEHRNSTGLKREEGDIDIETVLRFSVTHEELQLLGEVRAVEAGKEVFLRQWDRRIPRQLV
jgi:putative CocE/NonD family hydrolase